MATRKSISSTTKSLSFPYKVDYNDHFETPLVAYTDILPILDAVAPPAEGGKRSKKRHRDSCQIEREDNNSSTARPKRRDHVIYDPYYCDGSTKKLLQNLGFPRVQHEKRDFYKDIENNTIPKYDVLVTNPPYSDNHKEKCMDFAIKHLRNNSHGGRKPFFILMPNYCACRNYFRTAILKNSGRQKGSNNDPLDIVYVIPSKPYEYQHPEGTGKEMSPFASIWYCGIPTRLVASAKEEFRQAHGCNSVGIPKHGVGLLTSPRLVSSLSELMQLNAVPTIKRPNPKQRKKARISKAKELNDSGGGGGSNNVAQLKKSPNNKPNNNKDKQPRKRKRY